MALRRNPLGELLRTWRRTRRLSQLDAALVCEISQRHLSFVESGRAQASREMLLRIAEGLEIPLRERNRLFIAAGYAPLYDERRLEAVDMESIRGALALVLSHHEPYPAIVVNREWDLLMANNGAVKLLSLLGDLETLWREVCGDGPPNVFELCFHPRGLRPHIVNWQEFAPPLIRRAQREAAANNSERLRGMLAALREDPALPGHWHEVDWSVSLPPVLPMLLDFEGVPVNLYSMISSFGTPQDVTTDEIRIESSFPVDEPTKAFFRSNS